MNSSKQMSGLVGQQHSKSRATTCTIIALALAAVFLWRIFIYSPEPEYAFAVKKAVVVLKGDLDVTGTVTFSQVGAFAPVIVSGEIKNLDRNAKRGFHIHQLGDATNGCLSAGAHFNPLGKTHGAPTDINRHAGDLGNIETDGSGLANFTISDKLISLNGPFSIVGRSVVVHAGEDDLGKGGDEESLKTGNAGARLACGVIGLAELV
ncbi:SOD1 [Sanghuangporus baumii]